jgi:hypothetical protein
MARNGVRFPATYADSKPMTVVALGLLPCLMLGWILFCVAEISSTYPDIVKRRGCRDGSCRISNDGDPSAAH